MTEHDVRGLERSLDNRATVDILTRDGNCYAGIPTALRFQLVMGRVLGEVDLRLRRHVELIDFGEIVEVRVARRGGATLADREAHAFSYGRRP